MHRAELGNVVRMVAGKSGGTVGYVVQWGDRRSVGGVVAVPGVYVDVEALAPAAGTVVAVSVGDTAAPTVAARGVGEVAGMAFACTIAEGAAAATASTAEVTTSAAATAAEEAASASALLATMVYLLGRTAVDRARVIMNDEF